MNLHLEGLIKDFLLPRNCILNLELMSRILYNTMTFQEWEVQTPATERMPNQDKYLFKMPEKQSLQIRQGAETFFKDFLLLDSSKNSMCSKK